MCLVIKLSDSRARAVDPVCGMTVDPKDCAGSFEFEGKTYYFCSKSCLERFATEPRAYLDAAAKGAFHGMADLHPRAPSGVQPSPQRQGELDPVCGMTVDLNDNA